MILASASSRRAELLGEEGFHLDVRSPDVDETRRIGEGPVDYVERLAIEKARWVHESDHQLSEGQTLVAADTIVWTDDGKTFGKPRDDADVRRILRRLSGVTHHVTTGVCVLIDGKPMSGCISESSFAETTDVTFYKLTDADIEWYLSTGEPYDKAGAYAIQGRGRRLVKCINGDFYNVVGLPVARLVRTIEDVQRRLADTKTFWF